MTLAFLLASQALTVMGDLSGMIDGYLTGIAERHWAERDRAIAAIRTPQDLARRQQYIRERIAQSLGGWPAKTPLNARITGVIERDEYRIEKLLFESLPGFKVTANVYVPKRGAGPFPAVLGTAGHTNEGKAADLYQRGWIGMARRGMIVLAYDPPGQGERSEYERVSMGTQQHTMAGLQCILTGSNIARYETWDGIRAIDYLLTRTDVDPKRLAVAGNSGGGTQAAYLAAVEPRLAAAAPSCYITHWRNQWIKPGPQDAEQDFFGFIRDGLDFTDLLLPMAPKPVKMMTAIQDFFPIEGARATFREAANLWEVGGTREKFDMFEFDDKHGWSKPRREATYRWYSRWLLGRDEDGAEAESTVEAAPSLNVTGTGQLMTSGGSETVASLNRKAAAEMFARRRASAPGANLRQIVSERLGKPMPSGPVKAKAMGEVGRDGYRIERVAIESESAITVPALLFVPAKPVAGVVLWLDPSGKASAEQEIEKLVLDGHRVLAIDARGWGESAPPASGRSGYGAAYQTFMRAYLLGKSILGMQALDVMRAVDYLASRGLGPVTIHAKNSAAVVALCVAVMDPRVSKVRPVGAVPSYMEIVSKQEYDWPLDLIVHGVLEDFDVPDLVKALGDRYEGM
ncbi:MAG: acetylxylan esterase [Bryobacteraceae bacterium]